MENDHKTQFNRCAFTLRSEALVGLATDTTVYLSRRGEALTVNKMTFTTRSFDPSWHPGLPGRPLFPSGTQSRMWDVSVNATSNLHGPARAKARNLLCKM